ncbi:MAG: transposase [Pseudomonadota bacterium]
MRSIFATARWLLPSRWRRTASWRRCMSIWRADMRGSSRPPGTSRERIAQLRPSSSQIEAVGPLARTGGGTAWPTRGPDPLWDVGPLGRAAGGTDTPSCDKGASDSDVVRKFEVSEQTYHRWTSQFGGMNGEEVERLKDLERENAQLKRLVADLSLDNRILKDIAVGSF